jgi:hypothetical protein
MAVAISSVIAVRAHIDLYQGGTAFFCCGGKIFK